MVKQRAVAYFWDNRACKWVYLGFLLFVLNLVLRADKYGLHKSHQQQHIFEGNIASGPQVCETIRKQIETLTTPRRPARDLFFHGQERANISGWVGGNRLLDGCWTYKERYRHYDKLPETYSHQLACNRLYPTTRHARIAFVIRIGEDQKWAEDFQLAVRAAVVELGWRRGMDVYILQHIDNREHFDQTSIPEEFRPFTKQITLQEATQDYSPALLTPIHKPPIQIPLMAQYNHLAETHFMRTHLQYEHAWFSESDTRSTGPWDYFLNDIDASIAETMPTLQSIDLLTLTPSYRADPSWPWGNSIRQFPNSSITASLLQTHRVSRALSSAMHEAYEQGRSGYHELFVPTVATHANLTKFIYANPVFSDTTPAFTGMPFSGTAEVVKHDASRLRLDNLWIGNLDRLPRESKDVEKIYHGATYSPIDAFSLRYYTQWQQDDGICRPLSLVHPVKT